MRISQKFVVSVYVFRQKLQKTTPSYHVLYHNFSSSSKLKFILDTHKFAARMIHWTALYRISVLIQLTWSHLQLPLFISSSVYICAA